ncbi:MAG: TadE/TadG family type IV pilus assembly protein [Sphingopyxis sp.]
MLNKDTFLRRLRKNQTGNVMYLTAGLLMPIMATIGAGVDLGQAYMAKSRLQQACDAGVLSGRRAMADGTFGSAAKTAAERMFQFNFPETMYDSQDIDFDPVQQGTNEVRATASATVPTVIMNAFGKDEIAINVACTAKLEIANADIMFVLDTTGSMTTVNPGDTVSRIDAVRQEVMSFFDTVADAQEAGSIVRYGVVPYSSNVNVGFILRDANRSWISNTTELPSRRANFQMVQPADKTTYAPAYKENYLTGAWSNTTTYYTGYSSSACNGLSAPSPSTPVATSGQTNTATGTTTDASGNTVTTYERRQNFSQTEYRFQFQSSSSRCYRQQRGATYTQVTPYTVTQYPPVEQFQNYTYQATTYDVGDMVDGTPLVVRNGDNGADVTASWNGCIMERDTVNFSAGMFPPANALDLDIDMVPDNADRTKWKLFMPNIAYPSATSPWLAQSPAAVTTNNDHASYNEVTGGWAACPTQVMKMRALRAADRGVMQNYVNSLVAVGGTYHDAGMTWGARLISPTGLFASENATAANGNPISRHIIFMTDGDMAPNPGIYGFQGQEYQMERVGSNNIAELTDRHNTRFQAVCNAARARNITVWVVSFGTALNDSLRACASGDKSYQAANKAQLHAHFQGIAAQITRLRLSE